MGDHRDGAVRLRALAEGRLDRSGKTAIGPRWSEESLYPWLPLHAYRRRRLGSTLLGTDGTLASLRAATGEIVWKRSVAEDFGGYVMTARAGVNWRYAESPLVDGERVIVTPGAPDAAIVALRQDDRQRDLAGLHPEARRSGKRRRPILLDRRLQARGSAGSTSSYSDRARGRARRGRPVPMGLQPHRERRRQRSDADRERQLRLHVDRISDRGRCSSSSGRTARAGSKLARSTSFPPGRSRTTTAGLCSTRVISTREWDTTAGSA